MSYKQFKNSIKRFGLARDNRFDVEIPLPDLLLDRTGNNEKTSNAFSSVLKRFFGSGNEVVRGLSLMCEETELPGLQIATTETTRNGNTTKQPYSFLYNTQSFTFFVSEAMYEKNIFDEWSDLIIDRKTNKIKYYSDYITDITIHQLDSQENKIKSIVLKEAYPITINALPVNRSNINTFHRLTVEFAYKKWFDRADLYKSPETNYLEGTALYPFVSDALNDPVTRSALDLLNNAGIDLTGEAANIYNSIDQIVSGATGQSINRLSNILNEIKGDTNANDKISSNDKATLINLLDSLLSSLGG